MGKLLEFFVDEPDFQWLGSFIKGQVKIWSAQKKTSKMHPMVSRSEQVHGGLQTDYPVHSSYAK